MVYTDLKLVVTNNLAITWSGNEMVKTMLKF